MVRTISVAAVLTFFLVLALYAIVFGGNPLNRIGFAVFVSAFPAVVTLMIVKLMRLSETWWRVILIYVVVFTATVLAQAALRSIV